MNRLRGHVTTIVLTACALALGVVVLVVDRGSVSTNEATMRKRNLFDAWRRDDIASVTLRSRGHMTRLARAATTDAGQRPWDVEIDGARHAADEQVADQLLGTLEFAVAERRVDAAAVDRRAMGLDAPEVTVEVEMPPLGYVLAIGGPAASPEGARYAEVKGKGVVVVSRELTAALDLAPERLRTRQFVPYFSVDLAGLTIDGAGGSRRLERAPWSGSRSPSFRFEASQEGGARVATAAMDKILGAIADLSAEAFLTDDEVRKAGKAEITLTLRPRDPSKPTAKISLGGACPKTREDKADLVVAVRDAPTRIAACVPAPPLEALAVPAADLIDKRVIGAPADEITEVRITEGERALEIARSGAEWHVRKPEDRRADADTGRVFLGGLFGAEASAVRGAAFEPVGEARVVSLASGEAGDGGAHGERTETITWSRPEGGVVTVRRGEDGLLLSVPAAAMAAFTTSDLVLRSRRVVDEVLADARGLRVEGPHAQRIERDDAGRLTLVEPKGEGVAVDAGLASDLTQAVATLTADRWVAEKDDGSHGLATPHATITAEFRADAKAAPHVVKIVIGAATEAGSFAQREGELAVFVAPRAFVDLAGRWLVDRGALTVDAPSIAGVTVERGKKGEVVVSTVERGGDWVVDKGALPAGIEPSALRDAVSDLPAEDAVSLGRALPAQGLDPPAAIVRVKRAGDADVVLSFGSGDTLRGVNVVYARRAGVDVTYALAREHARLFLDAVR